jgi:hypothetical protein
MFSLSQKVEGIAVARDVDVYLNEAVVSHYRQFSLGDWCFAS